MKKENSASRIETIAELVLRLKMSRTTIYRGVKAGRFPAPVRISTRRIGWRSTDIDQFISGNGCDGVQS